MNNQISNQANGNPMVESYASTQSGTSMQSTNSQMSSQAAASAKKQSNPGMKNTKNVIGIFSSHAQAETAVAQLRSTGFTGEEINIVSKQSQKNSDRAVEYEDDDIADGTLTGGTLGGIGGLLLGVGALAIPGVGPILAAGPIAATIGGAMAGGIAGGLIDWGIPEEVSRKYEKNVSQGDILAIVRTDAAKVNSAAQILRQNGASDVESH